MTLFELLIIIAIMLLLAAAIVKSYEKDKNIKNQQNYNTTYTQPNYTQNLTNNQYMPYKRKNLLTKTEYNFYLTLKNICDSYNLNICPKVRLEDIAEVTDKMNLNKYRGYIKSRHVDFIICDNNLYTICAIELDDYTHNTFKAQNIDEFKNNLFNTIRLPLFRIIVGSNYVNEIQNMLTTLNIHNPVNNNTPINNDITNIINKQNDLIEKQNKLIENLQNTIKNTENSNKE